MATYLARPLKLDTLDEVRREMARLGVDKGGIPLMSAKSILRLILVEQIPTAAANCIKQEILARGGDLATPWTAGGFHEPHVDVILMGNLTTYRSLISKLYRQVAFDMPAIADVIQRVLMNTVPGYLPVSPRPSRQGTVVEETLEDLMGGRIPLEPATHRATGRPRLVPAGDHTWQFGHQTYVMGTVHASGVETTWDRAVQVIREGAHILDLGAESSRHRGSAAVSEKDEIARLVPLIQRVRREYGQALIAVDTWKAGVARAAVEAGAHLIDDAGLLCRDGEMKRVAAETGVPIVLMHNQGAARCQDLLSDVARFFCQAMTEAVAAGVKEEQIILDPGLGCGKSVQQDRELTRRLRELTGFGRPLLYAPSPQLNTGRWRGPGAPRESGTAALVALGIAGGADMVRGHDAAEMVRCANLADSVVRGYKGPEEQEVRPGDG